MLNGINWKLSSETNCYYHIYLIVVTVEHHPLRIPVPPQLLSVIQCVREKETRCDRFPQRHSPRLIPAVPHHLYRNARLHPLPHTVRNKKTDDPPPLASSSVLLLMAWQRLRAPPQHTSEPRCSSYRCFFFLSLFLSLKQLFQWIIFHSFANTESSRETRGKKADKTQKLISICKFAKLYNEWMTSRGERERERHSEGMEYLLEN